MRRIDANMTATWARRATRRGGWPIVSSAWAGRHVPQGLAIRRNRLAVLFVLGSAMLVLTSTPAREAWSFFGTLGAVVSLPLVPLAAGAAPTALFFRSLGRSQPATTRDHLVLALPIGLVVLLDLAWLSSSLGVFSLDLMISYTASSALLGVLIAPVVPVAPDASGFRVLIRKSTWSDRIPILAATALGLLAAATLRWWSPFPLYPAWDEFTHLTAVTPMFNDIFAPLPSELSRSFHINAYPSTFHLLSAIAIRMTGGTPIDFIGMGWFAPFLTMPILIWLFYRIGQRLGATEFVSLSAAVLSMWFFRWSDGFSPIHLSPALFAAIFLLLGSTQTVRHRIGWFGTSLLIHPTLSLVGIVTFAINSLMPTHSMLVRAIIATGFIAFTVSVAYPSLVPGWQQDLNPLTGASSSVNVNPQWAMTKLLSVFGSPLLFVIAISGFWSAVNTRSESYHLAVLLFVILSVYFVPISGTERISFLIPFIALSVFFSSITDLGRLAARATRDRNLADSRQMRSLTAIIIATTSVILAGHQVSAGAVDQFLNRQRFESSNNGIATSFTQLEIEAARVISSATASSALLLSDPETQNVVASLAARESFGGGPYADPTLQSVERSALRDVQNSSYVLNLWSVVRDNYSAPPGSIIVVYSGRTERWLGEPRNDPRVYQPFDLSDSSLARDLGDQARVIFESPQIIVAIIP